MDTTFLLTVELLCLQLCFNIGELSLHTSGVLLLTIEAFLLTSWKVCLISASMTSKQTKINCKQAKHLEV